MLQSLNLEQMGGGGGKARKRIEKNITPTFAKQTMTQTEIVHCPNSRPMKSEEIELNKFQAQN